jgi:hypothetical protein
MTNTLILSIYLCLPYHTEIDSNANFNKAEKSSQQSIEVLFKSQNSKVKIMKIEANSNMQIENQEDHKKNISLIKVEAIKEKYTIIGVFAVFYVLLIVYMRIKTLNSKEKIGILSARIESIENKSVMAEISLYNSEFFSEINRDRIDSNIKTHLNDTDWKIISLLNKDPFLCNKELAEKVNRSEEGTSSSLRKMYRQLKITVKTNKKLALLKEAIRLSQNISS